MRSWYPPENSLFVARLLAGYIETSFCIDENSRTWFATTKLASLAMFYRIVHVAHETGKVLVVRTTTTPSLCFQ